MNAWRWTREDSAADGVRGPWIAMMSWTRTSRRVPLNVTPTCGADSRCAVDREVGRILDVEERRHLDVADEPHRVLVQQAVAAHRADGPERSAAEILDVVAFHHRRVGVEEEAPVRLVAAEQQVGAAPV